jgi:hypothetical protein
MGMGIDFAVLAGAEIDEGEGEQASLRPVAMKK